MLFREKSAWICLVSIFVVVVPNFTQAVGLAPVAGLLVPTVFAIVAQIALAVGSMRHDADERDAFIASRSRRCGG